MAENFSEPDQELVKALLECQHILIFTGAGMAAVSEAQEGRAPQERGKSRLPVMYYDFLHDPEARARYWQMQSEDWAADAIREPNEAHRAVTRLEKAGKLEAVITQNVDGLHGRAGLSPERLIEIHGTNALVECQNCNAREDAAPHYLRFQNHQEPARCACGGWWKPATISLGQSMRETDLTRAQDALLQSDLVLSLGSSLSLQPAASFTFAAARAGIPYFILHEGVTEHDNHPLVSGRIEGPVEVTFPAAVDAALLMAGF